MSVLLFGNPQLFNANVEQSYLMKVYTVGTYQVLGLFNPQLVFCILPRQMLQL